MESKQDLSQFCRVLYESLKCDTCGSHVRAGKYRWFQCIGQPQHRICQDCKEEECSECNFPTLIEHCAMTENLLKTTTMQFKCMNTSRGCQEFHGEEAMIAHEAECIQRMVKCPRIPCKSKVQFHDLLEHIKENDEMIVKDVETGVLSSSITINSVLLNGGFSLPPVKFEFDGNFDLAIKFEFEVKFEFRKI